MSSKMMMLCDGNAKGLQFLTQHRFEDAARTFRSCLSDLHAILMMEEPKDSSLSCSMDLTEDSEARSRSASFYELAPASMTSSDPMNDDSPFLFYNKAILIVPNFIQAQASSRDDGDRCTVDEHLFSAAFLYNLGLSFQLRAHAGVSSRSKDLNRAMSLYNMAIKFFHGMTIREEKRSTLLQLAVYNNMAHIHLEHFDLDAFSTKMAWMSEVIQEVAIADECEEHSFFALNLVMSDMPRCFSQAAAA